MSEDPVVYRRSPLQPPFLSRFVRTVNAKMLGGILVIVASLSVFITLGGKVREGETQAFDRMIMLALRNPLDLNDPIGPRWLEEVMRDITALGGVTLLTLITLITVTALYRSGRWRQGSTFLIVIVAAQYSSAALKLFYGRPRPDLVPHGVLVYSNSFPSGHSTMAAAVYFMLAVILANLVLRAGTRHLIYAVAIVIVVLVGVSRVYLGVHWPTDVLAGWALGIGWSMLGWAALSTRVIRADSLPLGRDQ